MRTTISPGQLAAMDSCFGLLGLISTAQLTYQAGVFSTRLSGSITCHTCVKVPKTSKYFFAKKESLRLFETHCSHFFPFSNKSCHFIGFESCENPSIFCSRPSQKGSGSIPVFTSQSTLHALLQRVNAMEISLWRKNRNRPTPLLTRS